MESSVSTLVSCLVTCLVRNSLVTFLSSTFDRHLSYFHNDMLFVVITRVPHSQVVTIMIIISILDISVEGRESSRDGVND